MTREEREDAIKFFEEVAKKEINNAKYSKLAIEALELEPKSPCDLCRFNPPGSGDGKPCTMCPAEGR